MVRIRVVGRVPVIPVNSGELLDILSHLSGILDNYPKEEDPQHRQIPVRSQLNVLGLDRRRLRKLKRINAKGLDIGCGNGGLVNKMKEWGVDFTGIDKNAPEGDYFFRQNVTGKYPGEGSIPMPDESYDIAVSVENGTLNHAFIDFYRNTNCECHNEGPIILSEGLRVLRPKGRYVVFPGLDLKNKSLMEVVDFHKGVSVHQERMPVEYLIEHYQAIGLGSHLESEAYRTIFYKEG
ncbi:MAG: methyltransferase domain-containing protein [archaeon]